MQTTSNFMPPLFSHRALSLSGDSVTTSVFCLVAYLWKVSSHPRTPLPSYSIYSAQVPLVWTRFGPDSACHPSAVLLGLNVTRNGTPSVWGTHPAVKAREVLRQGGEKCYRKTDETGSLHFELSSTVYFRLPVTVCRLNSGLYCLNKHPIRAETIPRITRIIR